MRATFPVRHFEEHPMLLLALLALAAMMLVMTAAWYAQHRTRNAGWVDAFWSFGTGLTGAACALAQGGGHPPSLRAWLVAALALLWSGRLGFYIARRTAASAREDARYARFRTEWGATFSAKMFGLLMIQAAVAALLAICVMLAARNPQGFGPLDAAAALLLAGAVWGEAIADAQMHLFRRTAGHGKICDTGLWAWSRHPNYFFECLAWCAYPLFAFNPSWPWGLAAWAGPAAMVWLLTRVSGIPPLEREMVASRGDSYRAYQARVSAFVPLPPRHTHIAEVEMIALATAAAERAPLPDTLTRAGIRALVAHARRKLAATPAGAEADFAASFATHPIALHTDAANAQHYELPPEFFALVLGPRRKYSCTLYDEATDTLEAAEIRALEETCRHADLADGQRILELGCGWGSLSLWMAAHLPNARITAVSNSASQRTYIEGEAHARGLTNLTIITADMNAFDTGEKFDRVVSVEMFEHMANWRALLARIHGWLAPGGRLFIHVFAHRSTPYRFDHTDPADWIARHFFTGGLMPSHGLLRHFADLFTVEADWRWSGEHYRRTANAWLANYDRNEAQIAALLRGVYGADARLWHRRWRLFFLATAGLFGHAGGDEWGVSHYLLAPVAGRRKATFRRPTTDDPLTR
jgi:cyclopropane-fatty-acyl-phospholipid synthase